MWARSASRLWECWLPEDLPDERVILATHRLVPRGAVRGIRYVLFVPAEGYFGFETPAERSHVR